MLSIEEFGKYIHDQRQSRGLKLVELAKNADVSHSYLSQVENGKLSKMPSLDVLFKLSESLGIEFVSLMRAAGYEPTYLFKRNDAARYQNLSKAILSGNTHLDGYYPTALERFMFLNVIRAICSTTKAEIPHQLFDYERDGSNSNEKKET